MSQEARDPVETYADAEAHRMAVLDFLKRYVDDRYPGARTDFPLLLGNGFVVAVNDGVAVIFAGPGDPWYLSVIGAVAVDIADIPTTMFWINEQNRTSLAGKYYLTLGKGDVGAVVFDETVHGAVLQPEVKANMAWLIGLIRTTIEKASDEPARLLQEVGGRRFTASDNDLTSLVNVGLPGWTSSLPTVR